MNFPWNVYLLVALGAACISFLSFPFWRVFCERAGLTDDPGHRKIHKKTVPLAGGLTVFSALILPLMGAFLLVTLGFFSTETAAILNYGLERRVPQLAAIFLGAFGMLAIGIIDDRWELRPSWKFGGQFLIAFLVALSGVRITLFVDNVFFSYCITILWILTMINAVNFMDNMNGLCTGLGTIAAFQFGMFAAVKGHYLVAAIAFLIFGALLGFFPHNFPKARAFLGDSGSHLIGFLLAILAILPHFYTPSEPQTFAIFKPLLVLAVPLADMVWVVILRWRMGKPFYIGDTNHLSHRLERTGFSRSHAVLLILLLSATLGTISFLF